MSAQELAGRAPRPWRRRLRRAGLALLVLLVVLTTASGGYNLLTGDPAAPPAGLTFVQAGDVLTRYVSWGTSGSPVVLVHGAAESADTWSDLAGRLAARHRVFALDLDGWGYSRRVAPFDLDHQTRQLLALIAALHLQRPVLVGHSSGAAVVAEAALREPGSVGGLMFLDGDALNTGAGEQSPARFLLLPPYRTTVLRLGVRSDALIRSVYARACGPRCPALDEAGAERWRRPFRVAGAESAVWDMVSLGVPGLPVVTLQQLRSAPFPRSVVYGAQDPVFDAGSAQRTADTIGAGRAELIPQARHLTMISDPGPVAAAIETLAARAVPAVG
ncbi:MAG TPA: alpha/beta hydrolase [Kineosporiaceae bacterium]|nr:alpha/beta hydrolase [Kineosporiaceae bacterium]